MKATGIIRRVDDLGRVVIPKEIRRSVAKYKLWKMLDGCLKGVALYMKRLIAVLCAALMLLAAGAASAAVPVTTYRVGYTPTPGFFTRAQGVDAHVSKGRPVRQLAHAAGIQDNEKNTLHITCSPWQRPHPEPPSSWW